MKKLIQEPELHDYVQLTPIPGNQSETHRRLRLIMVAAFVCIFVAQLYLFVMYIKLQKELVATSEMIAQYSDRISNHKNNNIDNPASFNEPLHEYESKTNIEIYNEIDKVNLATFIANIYNQNNPVSDTNIKSIIASNENNQSQNISDITNTLSQNHTINDKEDISSKLSLTINSNGNQSNNVIDKIWNSLPKEPKLRSKRSDEPSRDRTRQRDRQRASRRPNRNSGEDAVQTNEVSTVLHLELHQRQYESQINQGEIIGHWRQSDDYFNNHQNFAVYNDGQVTISKNGVYLVYSQITFLDNGGRWSYAVTIRDPSFAQEKPFIKCLSTEWGIEAGPDNADPTTFNQCYTAAVAFIRNGEIVTIRSLYNTRSIHTDDDMSFWGFVKLA